jgi:Cd2+/Zn2+-exporting ATPase
MNCASCVGKIERALQGLPGVSDLGVSVAAERLTLRLDPAQTPPDAVERRLAAIGYPAVRLPPADVPAAHAAREEESEDQARGDAPVDVHGDRDNETAEGRSWWQIDKGRLVLGLGALVSGAWVLSGLASERYGEWIYLAATLVALWPFGRRVLALARAGSPFSIETLMVVAALDAVVIGAAAEAALVVFLFAVGELLENVAAGRARAGIRALVALVPRTARREAPAGGGGVEEVPAERLAIGDVVRIRPGDRVPCDGEIVEGQSALDESPVTGESVPVSRGPGEPVLAGSINADGVLRVRVTRAAADNTIARIVRMVEEATASRAPTQRFIERFAAWWTPCAMAVAALVVLVPPLVFGGDWSTWTYRGLALLLVACPCALVISVPASVASGLSAGARRGLLVKGGAALEAIGKATTIAFDKTGTLTAGRPRVTDVAPLAAGAAEAAVLRLAAAAERGSSHPLARAIVEAAEARGLALPPAIEAGTVPGKAVFATVEGRRVAVGSPRYAAEAGAGLAGPAAERAAALEAEGKTVTAVLANGTLLGLVALRDEPRPDAAGGVAAIRALGLTPVMLTGDNERTGRAVAGSLGMEVHAQLLPGDKLRAIGEMKAGGPVAMVGDGINDAPALAAASVGVAMGGGTDVALETADAALLRERVSGVAELVALSRATLANIRQNVAIALGLKAVFLATTVLGVTGLWPAILADTGATVLVTLNALRLLRWQPVGAAA